MINKISILILLLTLSVIGYSQQLPNKVLTGSTTTLGGQKGIGINNGGTILADTLYADTTAANLRPISYYNQSIIITGTTGAYKVWFRTLNPNKWNELNTSAASLVSISQAYGILNVPNPIVSTGTIGVDTLLLVPYTDTLKSNGIATKTFARSFAIDTTNKFIWNQKGGTLSPQIASAWINDSLLVYGGKGWLRAKVGLLDTLGQSGAALKVRGALHLQNNDGIYTTNSANNTFSRALYQSNLDTIYVGNTTTPTVLAGLSLAVNTNRLLLPTGVNGTVALTSNIPSGLLTSANAGTGISVATSGGVFTVTNTSPSSGGDVVGPTSASDGEFPLYSGTTGKLIKNSALIATQYDSPDYLFQMKGKNDTYGYNIELLGGNASAGTGGYVVLAAGTSANDIGNGIQLLASDGNGTNKRGGDITISSGIGTGSARNGYLFLKTGSGAGGYFDLDTVTTTTKTYKFPNRSGTVALLSDVEASKLLTPISATTLTTVSPYTSLSVTGQLDAVGDINTENGFNGAFITTINAGFANANITTLNVLGSGTVANNLAISGTLTTTGFDNYHHNINAIIPPLGKATRGYVDSLHDISGTNYLTPFSSTSLTTVSPYVNFSVTGSVSAGGVSATSIVGSFTNSSTLSYTTNVENQTTSTSAGISSWKSGGGNLRMDLTTNGALRVYPKTNYIGFSVFGQTDGLMSMDRTATNYQSRMYHSTNSVPDWITGMDGAAVGGGISDYKWYSGGISGISGYIERPTGRFVLLQGLSVTGSISGTGTITTTGNISASNITSTGATTVGSSLLVTGSTTSGTVSSVGMININTGSNALVLDAPTTTVGYKYMRLFSGTGNGNNQIAIEGDTPGSFFAGTTAYATLYGTPSARDVQFATSGVVRQTIDASGVVTLSNLGTGAVQATSGVLSVISDSRVKKITGSLNGSALNALMKIPIPQYWRYNSKSGLPIRAQKVSQFGLLADKVYNVLGEEFAPTQKNGMHSLSDRALLSLTIQALQEEKKEKDAQIKLLSDRLDKLEALINKKP